MLKNIYLSFLDNQEVALKFSDKDSVAHEALILQKLKHLNIVKCYNKISIPQYQVYALELQLLEVQKSAIKESKIKQYLIQILEVNI
jgi:hypothetical protein